MKLTYEQFESYMTSVVDLCAWLDALHYLCRNAPGGDCTIDTPSLMEQVVSLLEISMDDESEWISYWVYELDCGKRYKDGMITDSDGSNIKLATISDLWAILQPTQ